MGESVWCWGCGPEELGNESIFDALGNFVENIKSDWTGTEAELNELLHDILGDGVLAETLADWNYEATNSPLWAATVYALYQVPAMSADGWLMIFEELNNLGHWIGQNIPTLYDIEVAVNDFFESALNWVPSRDPLILDLDGDGIETIGASGQALFDHDGDGIKHATGWAAPDDGILVRDLNGNGTIDNGRELFGENTLLKNGEKATDGFSALADLDDNQDGIVDANDAAFDQLKVWRDLNSDGQSTENELFSLADVGIAGINTGKTLENRHVGNNNFSTAKGSFIKTDGSEGETGAAANLNFSENRFFREFPDKIAIPEELQDLPGMQGSGAVRDLKEAAAQSGQLAGILKQYQKAQTRDEQLALLDELLQSWADASGFKHFVDRLNDTVFENKYKIHNGNGKGKWINAGDTRLEFRITKSAEEIGSGVSVESTGGGGGGNVGFEGGEPTNAPYDGGDLVVGRFADRPSVEALAKIKILEAFNHQEFFNFNPEPLIEENQEDETRTFDASVTVETGATRRRISRGRRGIDMSRPPAVRYITDKDLQLSQQQIEFINESYQSLLESVYNSLVAQTRLKTYTDEAKLSIDINKGLAIDFSGMDNKISEKISSDPVNGFIDFIDLIKVRGGDLYSKGWEINKTQLQQQVSSLTAEHKATLASKGFAVAVDDISKFTPTSKDHVLYFGQESDGQIKGTANTNILFGSNGNESINGYGGNDLLVGGLGNDYLYGSTGDDVLDGGDGDDRLYGGAGNDTLRGGAGTDVLQGDAGNDTYLFAAGDGNTSISNYDIGADRQDILRFMEGIVPSDVVTTRSSDHLKLTLQSTGEVITVSNYFNKDGNGGYALNAIEFADGTRWDIDTIKTLAQQATANNDYLYGYANEDTLNGLDGNDTAGNDTLSGGAGNDNVQGQDGDDVVSGDAGNDYVYGQNGNDTLHGGDGDDRLYGGAGNDTLRGGAGTDVLQGDAGNDTYLFAAGDGNTSISNYD
ncbi:calcium-binding protein, partial [Endozoicomonas sp. SM1973]